jgi:hypothetical protein
MCVHCGEDLSEVVYTDKALHDGYLYPHGRAGYSGVTQEKVWAAQARCEFCRPVVGVMPRLGEPPPGALL